MTDTSQNTHIRRIEWKEIESHVKAVNRELWDALDPIMNGHKRKGRSKHFILAEYSYGQLLVDEGKFQLPCSEACSETCKEIASELKYSYIPLGLVLDKCVEVFVMREHGYSRTGMRLVPLRVLSKGELFGVFETLDTISKIPNPTKPQWSVSSGTRSVFIIAPLNNNELLTKIDKYLGYQVPRGRVTDGYDWEYIDHVAKAKSSDMNWRVQVLLFPDWINGEEVDLAPLKNVFSRTGWHQIAPLRSYVIEEAEIARIYMDHAAKKLAGRTGELYYYFTVRHLLAISKGEMPAFQPVTSSESQGGPFLEFQEIISSINVLNYYPVILQPGLLSESNTVGYYSVNQPSLLSPVPDKLPKKTRKAFVADLSFAIAGWPQKQLEDAMIDRSQMRFYSDWGQSNFGNDKRMPATGVIDALRRQGTGLRFVEALDERRNEFLPPNAVNSSNGNRNLKVQFKHRFFDGAIRIVRKQS
ncbi:MAG TPA: hypothetical protein VJR02_20630 [Pyrinomonadaceae bacterium]|nr:hypothetical protein [Pyrinomonadaceae bacterium]